MDMRIRAAFIGLALTALLVASSAAAAQPTSGFAQYKISLVSPMGQRSLLVNESYSPSDRTGYTDLVLQLIGSQQNLTYSRLVNASSYFLPYLPSVAPQSLDYAGKGYSLHLNVTTSGTAGVTFSGTQYTMDVLTASIAASYGNKSFTASGTVETFPSALVYSVNVVSGPVVLNVVLQATDLPLTSATPQASTAAYVSAGVGVSAVAVLGGAFLIRQRGRKAKPSEDKPLHWVD